MKRLIASLLTGILPMALFPLSVVAVAAEVKIVPYDFAADETMFIGNRYKFTIDETALEGVKITDFTDINWELVFPGSDDRSEVYCSDHDVAIFETLEVQSSHNYVVDGNELKGEVRFSAKLSGNPVSAVCPVAYGVRNCDMVPRVVSVSVAERRLSDDGWYYDLYLDVVYEGGDGRIMATMSQGVPLGAMLTGSWSLPSPATISFAHLVILEKAEVEVRVKNNCGTSERYTLVVPPFDPSGVDDAVSDAALEADCVEVVDLRGVIIATVRNAHEVSRLGAGMYTLRYMKDEHCVKVEKIAVK